MINTNNKSTMDIKKINEENLKVITVSIDLNQNDFPRLFELNKNSLLDVINKIITLGYNSYFPEIKDTNIIIDIGLKSNFNSTGKSFFMITINIY